MESPDPLRDQSFVTISKPARLNTGGDLRTVVIQVPEHDQVNQPSEEGHRGYLDPYYENVLCTKCQQGGDDALMLLCDLCDSPAHTYCVGLGREVPEGNWYCPSCQPTALASSCGNSIQKVCQPFEAEELKGYVDPYANVLCMECQQGEDDALMLLCDLCDSPAHTYCVGLGREVPEGNWYCESCQPAALASPNLQKMNPTPYSGL